MPMIINRINGQYNASEAQPTSYSNLYFQTIKGVVGVGSAVGDVTVNTNTTLSSDIYCGNFTVDSGVTLISNGYCIFCSNTFNNAGTINTGSIPNSQGLIAQSNGSDIGGNAPALLSSYGATGGGGNGWGTTGAGGGGGPNIATGGGGGGYNGGGGNGQNGGLPSYANDFIFSLYTTGFNISLAGTGGGGGGGTSVGGSGGQGVYGIYIQANNFINTGTINANGNGGQGSSSSSSGGGGGGAGIIVVAYGNSYSNTGTITSSGGGGGTTGGGSGGSCSLNSFQYTTPPIPITSSQIITDYISAGFSMQELKVIITNSASTPILVNLTSIQIGNYSVISRIYPAISIPANTTEQLNFKMDIPIYIGSGTGVIYNYLSSNISATSAYLMMSGYV